MKSFLFVIQTAAYKGLKLQEVLDQVLMIAAFDQAVSLLLIDHAVYHLYKNQHHEKIACKDIGAIYRSLKIYDIKPIYVEQESLTQRGLTQSDLIMPVTLINRQAIATTLNKYDFVLNA